MISRVEDLFFQARGRKWGIGEKIQKLRLNNKPMGLGSGVLTSPNPTGSFTHILKKITVSERK
jgi:hypothetical protein